MRSFLVIFGALYLAGATVDNALKGCPPAMNSKHTLVTKNGTVNQEAFRRLLSTPLCGLCRELMEDLKPIIAETEITEEAIKTAVERECEDTFGFFIGWRCKWAFFDIIPLIMTLLNQLNDKDNITYICDTIHLC